MRYLLILAVILLLGCKMPGVGELEERVDELESTTAYDDSEIVDRVDYVEGEVIILDQRVTALETGGVAEVPQVPDRIEEPPPDTPVETPEAVTVTMEDIPGLLEEMDGMKTALLDSVYVRDASMEELSADFLELTLALDSLTTENDSLKVQLEELEETVQSLSYTVDNLRYSGTSSTSGTSRSSSSSSSGGRTGTTSSTSTTTTSSGGR